MTSHRPNPFDLSSRAVLVTGASSGIGRETAIVLSELGAKVIVSARRTEALDQTRAQMQPGDHASEPFDLALTDQIPEWVKGLADRHGPMDGVVHCAGIRKTGILRGLRLADVQETFRINFDTSIQLAKGFRQKGCYTAPASMVFLSSASALVGSAGTAAYASSKAALIGLTKSLAIELAREGIRVNCIAAGMVESEMTEQIRKTLSEEQWASILAQHPLGIGHTRDVASAAAYLVAGASRWMTGHTLVLDGGYTAQ